MSEWPSIKSGRLLAALLRTGWREKRRKGSHRTLAREGWADEVFAFHDGEEVGGKLVGRIARRTGLSRDDL